jgi:myo-inositol 2-dehydrogenase/D-chiro-inositol 1-dehydrogenase
MTIRVGLIGAGVMGADHARILAGDIPGAKLVAVCDADAARAKTIAASWDAEPASDPEALIARRDIDAVLIASPDATHGPLTLTALAAGKPVLCEKPLAPGSAECLEIVAAEAKGGRRLVQVGFMRRFDPAYVDMKASLGRGTIGRPLMFHCFHRNVAAPAWFTADMAITNSAPHEFDIARFILDEDFASISVFRPVAPDPAKPGAPVFMVVETAGGQLVTFEINNNAAYGYEVLGELVGETGSISLSSPVTAEIRIELARRQTYPEDWRPRFAEAYRLQNRAWIKSIETGKPAGASAWDGYCASLIAEAGVAALASGGKVGLTQAAKPGIYSKPK